MTIDIRSTEAIETYIDKLSKPNRDGITRVAGLEGMLRVAWRLMTPEQRGEWYMQPEPLAVSGPWIG